MPCIPPSPSPCLLTDEHLQVTSFDKKPLGAACNDKRYLVKKYMAIAPAPEHEYSPRSLHLAKDSHPLDVDSYVDISIWHVVPLRHVVPYFRHRPMAVVRLCEYDRMEVERRTGLRSAISNSGIRSPPMTGAEVEEQQGGDGPANMNVQSSVPMCQGRQENETPDCATGQPHIGGGIHGAGGNGSTCNLFDQPNGVIHDFEGVNIYGRRKIKGRAADNRRRAGGRQVQIKVAEEKRKDKATEEEEGRKVAWEGGG